MILDPPSPIPFIPLSRAATATGGTLGSSYASGSWWKRGQKDYYHSAPGSANNSAHSSAHSSGNEGKGGKAGLDSLNTLIDDHHTMHHHPHGYHLLSDHWEDDAEASQEDGTWIVLDLLDQSGPCVRLQGCI